MEKKTLTEYDYTRKRVLVLTPRQAELLKLKEGDEASTRRKDDLQVLLETYDLNLPESENFETLGGMIVNFTEEIPSKDDSIIIDGYTINIIEVSNTKIELIELKNSSEN